ncbi:SPFH domain-containing protein [Streptomyces sp. NPDC048340]|uniref:SPFH domain-containing protein n=1 Tax=Streptomyces sp. NPDC048340 TaxID=3365537 RepID=UPI003719F71E
MYPTRTTSTTGTLQVPPALPMAPLAPEPTPPPAPSPGAGSAPEPASGFAPGLGAGGASGSAPEPAADSRPGFALGPAPGLGSGFASGFAPGLGSALAPEPASGFAPGVAPDAGSGFAPEPDADSAPGRAPGLGSALAPGFAPEPVSGFGPEAAADSAPGRASEHAPGLAPHAGFGLATEPAARSVVPAEASGQSVCDVPAARVETEAEPVHAATPAPGVDIPHPQDEAAHADVATQRLRTPEAVLAAEPAYGQRHPWPAVVSAGAEQHARSADEAAPYVRDAAPPVPEPWPAPVALAAAQPPAPAPEPVAPYVRDMPAPAPEPEPEAEPEPEPEALYVRDEPAPGYGPALDRESVAEDAAPEPAAPYVRDEPGAGEAAPEAAAVPGVAVADIVARAVARGMEDDTLDLPAVGRVRGTAVTDVPVHLPFRGAAQAPAPAQARRPATRRPAPAPGRRVPRGDDRLREHRGPVIPGWIGVAVGGIALTGCAAVLWRAGAVPAPLVAAFGATPRAYRGLQATHWPPLAFLGIVALLALGGLGRARTGHAWVLTLFGRYRGTVRRTGLTWVSPLLLRRRVDVRLRHWRSDPMPAVDSGGLALQVVVQVVWQVKDTARATLAVADHTEYLAEQVESAMARVLSQLPADAFHEDAPTLRDAEAVGDALTRMLAAETEAVGVEVYSAQPTRIEYAPEVAEAMRRRRVAAIDAKHRDTVLTSVVDAVDDTVHRLTSRGLVELDDYERKALVKDLTVAFYTGRAE